MTKKKIIILPGNGCTNVRKSNFYGWLQDRLLVEGFEEVILENMPDPYTAKEKIWVPFLHKLVGEDGDRTVVIGHSSGAQCAMRYLEQYHLYGVILVSACWTDLGNENEKRSGYYSRPWEWETIRANVNPAFGIVQFHSSDDPFIPLSEAIHVAGKLNTERHFFENRSHFFSKEFEELVTLLKVRLRISL